MNEKKRLNYISIEPETHGWLIGMANRQGEHIGDLAGQLLDEVATSWQPPSESEPERKAYWDWVQFKRDKRMQERAYEAALMYRKNPTEKGAERLARICEGVGLDYTEVLQGVDNDPFASLIAFSRNGSVLGRCIRWLPQFIGEREGKVPVRIVHVAGRREGYSESTINRARRAINYDIESPSIDTNKEGSGWIWSIGINEL